jgi:DNA-binding transcriptional ArsR family regulator
MSINKKRNEFFDEMARTFKLLGTPIKLKLLNYISFCPRTVEDCANKFDQSVQNISLHLIALAKAEILDVEQIKNYRYYSLSSNRIVHVVSKALLADPRSLLSEDLLWTGSYSDLAKDMKSNKVVIIDLRDKDEASYLPVDKALLFDEKLSQLLSFLETVPTSKSLIFFCKGRMCERLSAAVEIANHANLNVKGLALSANELKEFCQYLN